MKTPNKKFIPLAIILAIAIFFVYKNFSARSASYSWFQTNWSGGASTTALARHPGDTSGWTKFQSKDSVVTASTTGQISLASTTASWNDTSTTDFSAGILGGAAVVGDGKIELNVCPLGYILVPGNAGYGTSNFCVMKYEAKCASTSSLTQGLTAFNSGYDTYWNSTSTAACTAANNRRVVSTPTGYPLAYISQTSAIAYCSALGAGFHLMTNNEWMTIARNAEQVPANWIGGSVGGASGIWRGHSDNSPALALRASSDDTNGYYLTGNVSSSQEKRTLTLSNGKVIWDLSGNLWEWTSDTVMRKDQPHSTSSADNAWSWNEFTTLDSYGTLSYNMIRPSNSAWNSTRNMGQIYTWNPNGDANTTVYAFKRGGIWYNGSLSGVFTLVLYYTPGNTNVSIGFRCAR